MGSMRDAMEVFGLQVTTIYARGSANQWKGTCQAAGNLAEQTEHEFDWCGHGAHWAEWRNKPIAIMTARLIHQIDNHQTQRTHTSVVHLRAHTRVDKGARTYVQSPKNGPHWDRVARRVTVNPDGATIIQDIKVQDQPIGCNYNAPLPSGVTNIVLDCMAGLGPSFIYSATRGNDHAQGELRPSMTIVCPPID
eukprot:4503344-Pyramimonas_sp.AAC.1